MSLEPFLATEDAALQEGAFSAALVSLFRGKLCNVLLGGRRQELFEKDAVLYEVGDRDRNFFFIREGFVKVGTILQDGREIIYDIRKEGDVAGELCAAQQPRRDRAVALERTQAILVPYTEVISTLQSNPEVLTRFLEGLWECLADAFQQINVLALHDVLHRLASLLINLAAKIGRPSGDLVQIPAYLTQEELSQMVAARRERVSTSLNMLRRRGALDYSSAGHLILRVAALREIAP